VRHGFPSAHVLGEFPLDSLPPRALRPPLPALREAALTVRAPKGALLPRLVASLACARGAFPADRLIIEVRGVPFYA